MIMIFWSFLGTVHCTFSELLGALPLGSHQDSNLDPLGGGGASSTPRPAAAIGDDLHHDFFTILNMCIDPCIGGRGESDKYNSLQEGGGLNKEHSI